MSQTIQRFRAKRRRDWRDVFSWFRWFLEQVKPTLLFQYGTVGGRQTGTPTFTRASAAYTLDATGTFQSVATDVPREADHLWDGATNHSTGGRFLLESACTNSALGSSDFSITTYWPNSTGPYTLAAATSCINGQAATKHTNNSTANNAREQSIGTFVNGQVDCAYAIIEQGTATTARVDIRDATIPATAGAAILTWSTMAVSTVGSPTASGAITLAATGPNGGKLALLWVTFTGTGAGTGANGNTRAMYLRPTGTGADTTYAYLHHAQFQAATNAPQSPIVTVAAGVTRAADVADFVFDTTAAQLAATGLTIYEDYIITEKDVANCGRLLIGAAGAGGTSYIHISRQASDNIVAVFSGVTLSQSGTLNPTIAIGDRIERLATIATTGSATLSLSVNGGAVVTSAAGAAGGWPASFDNARIYLTDEATAARKGGLSRRRTKMAVGVQTMATMRGL